MSFMPHHETDPDGMPGDFQGTTEKVRNSTNALGIGATTFARAMSKAFADATTGGKHFDDVLKQLALRLSGMAVTQAFRPLARGFAGGLSKLIGDIFGDETQTQGKSGRRAPAGMSFMDAISGLTPFASGGVIGTLDYISPEQIQGAAEVDSRADIYSLGVMTYQVLTGTLPFKHNNPAATLLAHLMQPPPNPKLLVHDLSAESADAVMIAMAKKPEQRFATAGAFIDALCASDD